MIKRAKTTEVSKPGTWAPVSGMVVIRCPVDKIRFLSAPDAGQFQCPREGCTFKVEATELQGFAQEVQGVN
jgi:hypothetical protein